jgi:hypothetical protein
MKYHSTDKEAMGKSMKIIATCLVLAVLLVPGLWASMPEDFKLVGPGGGGAMFHPTISPHDPNTVLVACDISGGYVTHDGGKSWRMFNLRGVIDLFAFDPVNPKTLYVGTRALWRSIDGGSIDGEDKPLDIATPVMFLGK